MTLRVSALVKDGPRPAYGIITEEILHEIFNRRLLAASLLARAGGSTGHAASMVCQTLQGVEEELRELMG